MPNPAPKDFAFRQVDVFTDRPLRGNPLAVVLGAEGLEEAVMARFANWTNLSETTFLLPPTTPEADYRVRIFTPFGELPFAGHPTLGSCHAWLEAGGVPRGAEVVQECGIGLVRIRRTAGGLAFAAPPLRREGPPEPALLADLTAALGLEPGSVLAASWVENGPDWLGLLLPSRAAVLAVRPDFAALGRRRIGLVGAWDPAADGTAAQFEVRAFTAGGYEDPVTGSLNAGLARWLIGAGIAPDRYVASQGTVLGREGRVFVERDGAEIWIGGAVTTCITGRARL
ncbi:PhzF family phenazine biosynthesis protein [Roseomonas sp. OT10]|uniref:PhzF family phenazine biosynthesis protein n=1 Tax=Roseomonas cutis TaxID=2897332 RepID=UPI001E293FCA|nr:PhzF family phenazine biosynthesis protein [Roseomonas sp. OT10]UFN50038.1 PhzF family phenazine biosynthesis protein [Roseomonas sp. OT10]